MQEFIKKLIERLEELREKGVNCEGCSNDCVNDGCEQRAIDQSIEIVNQLAEEYKDSIKSQLQEVIDELEIYTAGRLKTSKVSISVLQLQRYINRLKEICQLAKECKNGWIPCSEQSVPNEDGRYEVTCETLWNDGRKSYSTSTLSFYKEDGWCAVFGINTKVIAWRKPAPYQPKGE